MKLLLINNLFQGIWADTGFSNLYWDNGIMRLVGISLIVLAIKFNLKPILLIPLYPV